MLRLLSEGRIHLARMVRIMSLDDLHAGQKQTLAKLLDKIQGLWKRMRLLGSLDKHLLTTRFTGWRQIQVPGQQIRLTGIRSLAVSIHPVFQESPGEGLQVSSQVDVIDLHWLDLLNRDDVGRN